MIYTIGHSTRDIKDFINILKNYKIEILFDVRRFPVSRKYPQFNKENLKNILEKEGIKYVWEGETLGGYRKGGYLKYTQTEDFKRGILKVIETANKEKVCLMCAEKLFFRCHRRFISKELRNRGFNVIHIIDEKRRIEEK